MDNAIHLEIGKFYEDEIAPVGTERSFGGKVYRFCKMTGAVTLYPHDPLNVNMETFVVANVVKNTSVPINGLMPMYLDIAASTTYYFLVQTGGPGYGSVDDALIPTASVVDTTGRKMISDANEDRRLDVLTYDDATVTAQEIADALLIGDKSRIIGAGNTAKALTGTITTTNASTSVTGSGTKFLTELQIGSRFVIDRDSSPITVIVASIQSDTALTLASGAGASKSAKSGYLAVAPVYLLR